METTDRRADGAVEVPGPRPAAGETIGCFFLLIVGLYLVLGPHLQLMKWQGVGSNPGLREALAWRSGRLDLPERIWDTAIFNGRAYNVYPPLFTVLGVAATTLSDLQGLPSGQFYGPWYMALVALPIPIAGYWAFRQTGLTPPWSAVLTVYLILGTPLHAMLLECRNGPIGQVNHVLATTGLLLFGGDLLGKQRVWPAAIGLVIAAWSRQFTVIFGIALLVAAWQVSGRSWLRVLFAAAGIGVAAGGLMLVNWLKFGDPLDTGYIHIYDGGRDDWYGRRAKEHGLFAAQFIPENAYYMNLSPPRYRDSPDIITQDNHRHGVSIWLTTPLLLCVVPAFRSRWRDWAVAALMAASLPVILGVLAYHSPGTPQVGFFRYALDFVPIWLLIAAPWATATSRRQWFVLLCLCWSALHFRLLIY